MEQLYRSFSRYFATRGWTPVEPRFPLVAVVLPDRAEFLQHAALDKAELLPGTVGYYSGRTNRIVLYQGDGNESAGGWQIVLHEATHQIAFNTGIHNRFAPPPLWLAEGLSTLFEATGVWNTRQSLGPQDRIHSSQLRAFQRDAAIRLQRMGLAAFVSSDEPFSVAPDTAYAMSWALTFFLAETVPKDYVRYVRRVADRPNFAQYPPDQRLADFRRVFGDKLEVLQARLVRYMAGLPQAGARRTLTFALGMSPATRVVAQTATRSK